MVAIDAFSGVPPVPRAACALKIPITQQLAWLQWGIPGLVPHFLKEASLTLVLNTVFKDFPTDLPQDLPLTAWSAAAFKQTGSHLE